MRVLLAILLALSFSCKNRVRPPDDDVIEEIVNSIRIVRWKGLCFAAVVSNTEKGNVISISYIPCETTTVREPCKEPGSF